MLVIGISKLNTKNLFVIIYHRFDLNLSFYILDQAFGGTVDIKDDQATYTGTFPRHLQGARDDVIFGNKTDEFMRKFQCETLEKLNENQVQILRASSDTIAFDRINANDFMVVAKSHEMSELKRKLKSKFTDQ